MSYINSMPYLFLFMTFYACSMEHPKPVYPNQIQRPVKKNLLFKYRLALLNFQLPNKEKPFWYTQLYALAHPEDQHSKTMLSFIQSYMNSFAESAYTLRDKDNNSSEIGPEFTTAVNQLIEDEESLRQLFQMHQHAKDQLAEKTIETKNIVTK